MSSTKKVCLGLLRHNQSRCNSEDSVDTAYRYYKQKRVIFRSSECQRGLHDEEDEDEVRAQQLLDGRRAQGRHAQLGLAARLER